MRCLGSRRSSHESGCAICETASDPETLRSAPDARASFLLRRQKKVAKGKATPRYALGFADSPARLSPPGGCATRADGPQTVLAETSRLASVARRFTRGSRKPLAHYRNREISRPDSVFYDKNDTGLGLLPLARKNSTRFSLALCVVEQRIAQREKGRGLSEPRRGEFRSPPLRMRRAELPAKPATQRARLLFGYFFLARQEKVCPPVNGGTQRLRSPHHVDR